MAKQKKTSKRKVVRKRKARVVKAPKRVQKTVQKRVQNKPIQKRVQEPRIDENIEDDSKEKYLFDEVNGSRNKKPVMSILNKAKLSKHEMDELFCDWS